ncbi:MAG: phage holin family protein [Xanthobacteraceae bacterium]|nr:phage holin family protein [Xanthobacteraceae bacterium]
MNPDNVTRNLRALWRADRIIADIRLRHMLVGLGLKAFAALFAAFGMLMLELAAYFALVQIWSAIVSAAVLGLFNFVVAAIILLVATRPPRSSDLELANEVHSSAIDALQVEVQALHGEIRGAFHHPLDGILPSLILPLIRIALRGLKSTKAAPGAPHPDAG